jgi:hypothetical protein
VTTCEPLNCASKHVSECIQNFEKTDSFPRVNSEREKKHGSGQDNILDAVQRRARTYVRRISMSTSNAPAQVRRILHDVGSYPYHPKEYKTFYWEITLAVCSFVNDCNHGYKFCLTFCSRIRLTLHVMALTTRGGLTLGHSKIH